MTQGNEGLLLAPATYLKSCLPLLFEAYTHLRALAYHLGGPRNLCKVRQRLCRDAKPAAPAPRPRRTRIREASALASPSDCAPSLHYLLHLRHDCPQLVPTAGTHPLQVPHLRLPARLRCGLLRGRLCFQGGDRLLRNRRSIGNFALCQGNSYSPLRCCPIFNGYPGELHGRTGAGEFGGAAPRPPGHPSPPQRLRAPPPPRPQPVPVRVFECLYALLSQGSTAQGPGGQLEWEPAPADEHAGGSPGQGRALFLRHGVTANESWAPR